MEQGNYNNPNQGQPYNQPDPNQYQYQQPWGNQQVNLANASTVMILGIISIFLGLIGTVLAIISLNMASKARAEYNSNPARYTASSLSQVNTGRICAIIALCIMGLALLIIIAALAIAA